MLIRNQKYMEAIGASTGVLGALIMSFQPEYAMAAWIFWLISSVTLLGFAFAANLRWIFGLQAVFLLINTSGIINTALRMGLI